MFPIIKLRHLRKGSTHRWDEQFTGKKPIFGLHITVVFAIFTRLIQHQKLQREGKHHEDTFS